MELPREYSRKRRQSACVFQNPSCLFSLFIRALNASALVDLGLPQGDIPLALFAFNVGVECGQLCFVAAVLLLVALARHIRPAARVGRYASQAAPYAIGGLAAF